MGLSIAAELIGKGREIILVERHDSFGRESSSRNSEVIHAGIYYPPGSLKARFCRRGREMLYDICPRAGIPFCKCGKLIIAIDESQLPLIAELKERAKTNGVPGLRLLSKKEVQELEPEVKAEGALWSPETGIIDSHSLMAYLEKKASTETTLAYNCELISLEKKSGGYLVGIRDADGESFEFFSRVVVNAAGLWADAVAKMAGIKPEEAGYTIHPCKGEYFRVRPGKKLFSRLIYPPPTAISLGIHTVIDLQGGRKLGTNAFYVDEIDYKVDESNLDDFFLQARAFLPALKKEDLFADMAGIRPKLYREGEEERDFVIVHEGERGLEGLINLIGIESPGLTAAPALGEHVAGMVAEIIA